MKQFQQKLNIFWFFTEKLTLLLPVPRLTGAYTDLLAGTRRPGDITWTSPKGPNIRDLQGTFRELLGDQQKIDDLMKKVLFNCNSPCFTHLFLFFTGKTNMQKVQLRDVPETRWWNVLGMSPGRHSYMFFLNSTQKHIKLTLTDYLRVYSEL